MSEAPDIWEVHLGHAEAPVSHWDPWTAPGEFLATCWGRSSSGCRVTSPSPSPDSAACFQVTSQGAQCRDWGVPLRSHRKGTAGGTTGEQKWWMAFSHGLWRSEPQFPCLSEGKQIFLRLSQRQFSTLPKRVVLILFLPSTCPVRTHTLLVCSLIPLSLRSALPNSELWVVVFCCICVLSWVPSPVPDAMGSWRNTHW